ncbi:MAG: exosome complex RNA-binding protein Csl4 [Candidatus Marsarchaeota archaeon]|nr:exosome complex RNA-binding protein Csl4 [Candidatus Marsarchaeota archaeon]MCL5112074.1 exosome complex RNA-binding protein Csl4 [Candidatus Marsarchaeota archaeon]
MDDQFVSPGEKLAMEEEYAPSSNTYVEGGVVYAAAAGLRVVKDGAIGIVPVKEIRGMERGMLVLGRATDAMKSVIFVEIDKVSTGKKEYLPLKDGKIILRQQRQFSRGPSRFSDRRERAPEHEERPCRAGDIVMAKVIAEENETYVLSLNGPEAGVVHSTCSSCGGPLQIGDRPDTLYCSACRKSEHKKLSSYYDKPEEIKNYFNNVR